MTVAIGGAAPATVVFRVAAGPRIGFGHLVRCRSLARALGVPAVVSVRGSGPTRAIAASLGWSVLEGGADQGRSAGTASLIIVDDPSPAEETRWVRRARRHRVPVVTIRDLEGRGQRPDLSIDGGVTARPARGAHALRGPRYAILDPSVVEARRAGRWPRANRVLIALGGGAHVYALAARLANAIAESMPGADIRVARGFSRPRVEPVLDRASWFTAHGGLAAELSEAAVAVVAGGVTLYEACAIGVPAVAVAVAAGQRPAIRAMARHGAVVDGGGPARDPATSARVASAVRGLMASAAGRRQTRAAMRLVDGRGVFRVAGRMRPWLDAPLVHGRQPLGA